MMILLKSPYPNHTTSKGAKAKIGMACDMTRKGVIAASTLGKLNMTIARGIDMARLIIKPSKISTAVTSVFSKSRGA